MIAEQCLRSIRASPVSHSAPPASGVRAGERLGGDQPGEVTQVGRRGYSVQCNLMSPIKTDGGRRGGLASKVAVAQRLAEHWSACGRWSASSFVLLVSPPSLSFTC